MATKLILLNGLPGCGKATIARHLQRLRPKGSVRRLGYHCWHPNPKRSRMLHPRAAQRMADHRRVHLKRQLRVARQAGSLLVVTDYLTDSEAGDEALAVYRAVAEGQGCQFVHVTVDCDTHECLNRVADPQRLTRDKVTDKEVLRPSIEHGLLAEQSGGGMAIDSTSMPPFKVAEAIIKAVLEPPPASASVEA